MAKMARIFVGLLHYPVYNKNKERITTSVTNLDIHDIARCIMTYDVEKYYLIHPLPTQKQLVEDIIAYWQEGYGAVYNPDRKEALARVCVEESLDAVKRAIEAETGAKPQVIVTDAKTAPRSVGYLEMRKILSAPSEREPKQVPVPGEPEGERSFLLLFGTGWGMAQEIIEEADYILAPVFGAGSYNHLSVRSAAAIILDRLLGEEWWRTREHKII